MFFFDIYPLEFPTVKSDIKNCYEMVKSHIILHNMHKCFCTGNCVVSLFSFKFAGDFSRANIMRALYFLVIAIFLKIEVI